ncbi:MAG TPA: Gfo/Idh/MocA family oxidoreductase [Myxococcota bacterium]|jgi:predicted dehydrogenase
MTPRVVILGNGYASYCQLPALAWAAAQGSPSEVVAICGRDLAKAQQTARRFAALGPLVATTSLSEALSHKPDLVLVATPVDLHASMVREILATTSAAVLCEKPFTLDVDEARALAALGQGRLCLVDHQLRFSAPRRRLRELVRGGAIGTPWVARSEMCFGSMERLTRAPSWWDDKERGGGAALAIGSHLVDGLLWTLGPVVDVQARLTTCVRERGGVAVTADDHAELWLGHASGARSTMLCTTVQVHGRRSLVEVIGSEGVVRLVDEDALFIGRHDGPLAQVPVRLPSIADVSAANDSAFARSEPLLLRALIDAVAAGQRELPGAATFADAVACVGVLAAARR